MEMETFWEMETLWEQKFAHKIKAKSIRRAKREQEPAHMLECLPPIHFLIFTQFPQTPIIRAVVSLGCVAQCASLRQVGTCKHSAFVKIEEREVLKYIDRKGSRKSQEGVEIRPRTRAPVNSCPHAWHV